MSSPKLLWIHDGSGLETSAEWLQTVSDFDVISVANLAGALYTALARQDMDCVLVEGPIPDGDRMAMLEALRDIDGFLPILFYDLDMTAAEAVRLHRSGAFNCLGQRDSLETLRGCLEQAAEERRCQSRKRFSTAREPWAKYWWAKAPPCSAWPIPFAWWGPRRCTVLISGESGTEKIGRARHPYGESARPSEYGGHQLHGAA